MIWHVVGDGQDGHTSVEIGHADGFIHDDGERLGAGNQLAVDRNVIEELGGTDRLEVPGVEQMRLDLSQAAPWVHGPFWPLPLRA